MKPFIIDFHHEVLKPWANLRKELRFSPTVITLDFHTDTLPCNRRGNALPDPGDWQKPERVCNAIKTLHHDEHFDWALRSALISSVTILAIAPQNGPCAHEQMKIIRHPDLPEINELLNKPEKYRFLADKMLQNEYLEKMVEKIPADPWILDLDCDFCLTAKTLDFPDDSLFAEMIRSASLITVSRESDWVRILRFPGEKITGESIAEIFRKRCSELRK